MSLLTNVMRNQTLFGAAALALFASTACNNNPVENKPIAVVGQAAKDAPVASAEAVHYAFSEQGSSIGFVGAKVTGKHDGSFGKFSGTIDLVGGDVARSAVHVEVQAASLSADQEKLTGHLKSPDFFDVERYPTITFHSTSVHPADLPASRYTITGNLGLHGVTKSISFPATIRVQGSDIAVESEFGINRKDFNIVYPGKPDDLIKDEVLVRLKLLAKRV